MRTGSLAVRHALDDATRAEGFQEGFAVGQFHVARVVALLGLFFGVEVVEAANDFIEAMHGGQVLVAVALVVFDVNATALEFDGK